MTRGALAIAALATGGVFGLHPVAYAHSGPPFPIVSNRIAGAYDISIWTDPDTTDDGRAAGRFWIVLEPADRTVTLPPATHASVAIRPLDRQGPVREARAEPEKESVGRQFVALVMDHEGPFAVHVDVDGPLGLATVDSQVDATYDLRPAPALFALYLFPFVAIGALWVKVMVRRRRHRTSIRRDAARAAELPRPERP